MYRFVCKMGAGEGVPSQISPSALPSLRVFDPSIVRPPSPKNWIDATGIIHETVATTAAELVVVLLMLLTTVRIMFTLSVKSFHTVPINGHTS